MSTAINLDGLTPSEVLQPSTIAELGEQIRRADRENRAVYPVGGGTTIDLGVPPVKPGFAVDMSGLSNIVDFPARDMTVTVQAGITIQKLADTLRVEKLRLPIDVSKADRATLGGIIATNACGARRLGYGTLRDFVIGIHIVNDEGQEFKAGGRVVKNVAGYDICKLAVGSMGTLGVISQVTLKLRPMVDENALIAIGGDAGTLEKLLDAIHASATRPVCVDLANRESAQAIFGQARLAAPSNAWTLLVGYEGNAENVQWQVQQLVKEVGGWTAVEARVGSSAEPLWAALADSLSGDPASVVLKATMLPSQTAQFCLKCDQPGVRLQAQAGNGIVRGALIGDWTKERATSLLQQWRALTPAGAVTTLRCPSSWKTVDVVWGPPPKDAWLMRAVKERFDPRRIFNPGRFVDGI